MNNAIGRASLPLAPLLVACFVLSACERAEAPAAAQAGPAASQAQAGTVPAAPPAAEPAMPASQPAMPASAPATASEPAAAAEPAAASEPQAAASPTAQAPAAAADAGAAAAGGSADTPYKVVDGYKVDAATLEGFRTWRAAACDRCHGANQEGMVGPSLIASLKQLSKEEFATVVAEGRLAKGMPSFKTSTTVMENMDELYAYLKGRSDGAITRAKVEPM